MNSSSPPSLAPDVTSVRAEEIRRAKRRATGLLVVVACAYLVTVFTTSDHGTWGFVRAGLEAAMVGGLADWFAVVAIFRHPLGLPIPHTAVIVRRKDSFGETLGSFVSENFLNPDTVSDRVTRIGVSDRASSWVLQDGNADKLAGYGAELAVRLADVVRDDDLVHVVEREVRSRLDGVDVAPLAARIIGIVTEDGRHRELVDSVLRGLDAFLAENEGLLRERFTEESPWWVPEVIDDRIFDRLLSGVRAIVRGDTVGGSDELTERIDAVVARIIDRLNDDEVWRRRAEELKEELLDHPALRDLLESMWGDAKRTIRTQAADDGSALRRRLSDLIVDAIEKLRADPALMARLDDGAARSVAAVVDTFGLEISELISGTVAGWDGEETASRLEMLLGRDLQFIRINGTVVGGVAGLVIHAIGRLAG